MKIIKGAAKFVVKGVIGGAISAVGVLTQQPWLISIGAGIAFSGTIDLVKGVAGQAGLIKSPKASPAQTNRLYATIDPSTPRKIVLGATAMPTDIRYEEYSGTNQEYLDRIICVASHAVHSIESIYFDDKLAWTQSGGVTSDYTGYLTVSTILEGGASAYHTVNTGTKWGATRRLTGLASVKLRYKLTGNSKKAESPFAAGVPSRITIVGKGLKLYDPRRDSTAGGSGTHRANDQNTWQFNASGTFIGENPALQILTYLLGWKINGKLAVGKGIPPARIDMASFIAAANICDESVQKADLSSETRYLSSGVFSEADAPTMVLDSLLHACRGTLRDSGGQLRLDILVNDLGTPVATFDDDDILGPFEWAQTPSIDQTVNVVRGRYTDPSTNSLYQMVDYPEIRLTSPDGIDRIMTLDLPLVQASSRAQRIAKQVLQREQYQGLFRAPFSAKAWGAQVGDVVSLTFQPLGWSNKLFRIVEQAIQSDGIVPMLLREENADIYAWDKEDTAPVEATEPTSYNPLNAPLIITQGTDIGVENGATRNVFAGVHNSSLSYVAGDYVRTSDGTASYIAKINVPSGILLTNTVYWDLFVQGSGGTAGANAIYALLTNESHVVATDSAGNGANFTNAGGTMRVFDGTVEKTTSGSVTFSVASETGVDVSITSSGVYTVNSMSADQGTATFQASYGGVTLQVIYSIAKSKAGAAGSAGANAKTLQVFSDRQNITYDATGSPSPSAQTTTFTVAKQNTTATVTWSMTRVDGTSITASSYLSATTGDSVTMTAANFNTARGSTNGVIVTGTITDGSTISDKISVVRVADGAQGNPGQDGANAFALVTSGNVTRTGSTVTCSGASGYTQGAHSVDRIGGGVRVSFTADGIVSGFGAVVGLNGDQSASYGVGDLDYGLFLYESGGLTFAEATVNGVTVGSSVAWGSVADVWAVDYDGRNAVRFTKNGAAFHTIEGVGATLVLGLDMSFRSAATIKNLAFTPRGSDGLNGVLAFADDTSIVSWSGAAPAEIGSIDMVLAPDVDSLTYVVDLIYDRTDGSSSPVTPTFSINYGPVGGTESTLASFVGGPAQGGGSPVSGEGSGTSTVAFAGVATHTKYRFRLIADNNVSATVVPISSSLFRMEAR